jgi:hypothetical protein
MTRRELIAEVEQLGRDLGEELSTDRLSNAALGALVESLRAKLEEKTRPPATPVAGARRVQPEPVPAPVEHVVKPLQADQPRPPPPVVHDPPPKPKRVDGAAPVAAGGPPPPKAPQQQPPSAPYYVAPGRSIVANGRVLGPMKPVKASFFQGGQADLDYFVLKGAVIRS